MNLIFLILSAPAFAANTEAVEIFLAEPAAPKLPAQVPPLTAQNKNLRPKKTASAAVRKVQTQSPSPDDQANIPAYFSYGKGPELHSKIVLSTDTKQERLLTVKAGDTARIEITHSIIAFPDEKACVVAAVKSGALTGAKLFGSSTLEKNSKRIFIEFERVSFGGSTYELKASAVTDEGVQGFIGEHHSRESGYFAGDFISSFVAAYFDAQVPRTTNAFGQIQDDRSVDSAFKKGLASGAMSSADRFKETLKKVPEFAEISGPIYAKILIYEGGQRL